MNDDEWRLRIAAPRDRVREIVRAIEHVAPSDFEGGTGARFPVSHSEDQIFVYADSEAEAQRALAELEPVLADHDLRDAVTVWRWHPIEERWEDASQPLPQTELDIEREHARRQALEARRSRETGLAEWEVRITLPTRDEARALADRLRGQGVAVTRGWRHVMAGAATEDEARQLAQRLRDEAPEGSLLHVEPSGAEAWRITHPFAIFGGLGG